MIGPSDVCTGTPHERGRYLVFLRCVSLQIADWVQPSICNWNGDRWDTTFLPQNRIVGYVGPIAPMKVDSFGGTPKPAPAEYDL